MRKEGPRTKVVLVVEDDRAVGELIAGALCDELGYSAIHVLTPALALEAVRKVKPDVLIIDVRLPEMSGFELYDRLRQDPRTREVPVLFETASGAENAGEFRRRGIASYVAKPFDLWDVVGRVKRLATNGGAL